MKFSVRQILASTAGAVIAALVASTFGVKGTIVGVAIGSAAATMGTAFVAQSIERGHEAVKQVAIKAPETSTLLRKLGGTGASGDADTHASAATTPTQVVRLPESNADAPADTVQMSSSAAAVGETERLEISATADAPATERLVATTAALPAVVARPPAARRFTWQAIAASAVVVFVLALLLITAVELISGKPLSDIFGGAGTGTSVGNLTGNSPAPATTPTTTPTSGSSTTSTSGSSTTTTTTAGTTTSTTAPAGAATSTTTTPPSQSTTTSGPTTGTPTSTTPTSAP